MIRAKSWGEHRRGGQESWGEQQLRSEELLPGGEGSGAGGAVAVLSGLQMDVGAGRAANKSLRRGLQGVREHCKSSGDIRSPHKAANEQDCK